MDRPSPGAQALSPVKQRLLEQLRGQQQAARVGTPRGRAELPVVALNAEGDRVPFFCVAPAGGSPLCYLELARALGPDQPFYGFQSQGLLDGKPMLSSVEDMVTLNLQGLRTVQPEGPYLLGGWSFGGIVAFEMARRLEAEGQKVALLALLDGGVVHSDKPLKLHRPRDLALWLMILGNYVSKLKPPTSYEELRVLAQWVGVSLPVSPRENLQGGVASQWRFIRRMGHDLLNAVQMFTTNTRAGSRYVPGPYGGGRVALLRTPQDVHVEADPLINGVRRYCTGELEIYETPGSHLALMMDKDQVEALAKQLRWCLERAVAP
ncbi:thioesterase domain-containing protein [Corallococcus terminator]|uniref:thioesterase domain-containing protein n=1 Tax=Corallococcus terminator TaxID=2316733 RepID=UPI001315866C|nr:alpha/beta fold hydrolase [Corallococcus terminator]